MCTKKSKMPPPAAVAVAPPTETTTDNLEITDAPTRKAKGKRKLTIPTASSTGTGVNI